MARLARVVAPGWPHHVLQRGNRHMPTFFREEDYQTYLDLLTENCREHGLEIWAYCLMPNQVNLLAVPREESSLARAVGEAHRRYTRMINLREGWRGHLWQERFSSFPVDETHALLAARYVELIPVQAGLVHQSADYPWSSAAAHLNGRADGLVNTEPLLKMINDWEVFISSGLSAAEIEELWKHERTGRPLGHELFLLALEQRLGRSFRRRKPGPKKKSYSHG